MEQLPNRYYPNRDKYPECDISTSLVYCYWWYLWALSNSLIYGLVYLTLGSGPRITTDNIEILITTIGEDSGLPSLTCHTDLTACCRSVADSNGNGALGQWTYPNRSVILGNGASATAGEQFYIIRGAPQVIRLNRRETTNPLTPTGSYCCTVPTTGGGEMTLCANLGECRGVGSMSIGAPPHLKLPYLVAPWTASVVPQLVTGIATVV